ncbi:MAG: AAA family ATPase [Bacteroidaceae bacterium]|nr:AAA family ATPase [Bacteroidaceae bacterium]
MKILAVRGKNLASLEGEFNINFRGEPLCSTGIYAITGCTGSGKSTLLDAICIALFNKSPRTYKISKPADIEDIGGKSIKENDPRNILRRGTSDGFAEVDFLAIDKKEYRATWSVYRAYHKANGTIKDDSCTLFCISDNIAVSGGKTETLKKISELIGLTYEQFTRAVLLAQGEFATFLKGSSHEKAEILEKLTGTEIYSEISMRIYEKKKRAEEELRLLREKINEIELLDEEKLRAIEEECENLLNENKCAENSIKSIEGKIKWFERYSQLQTELNIAEQEVNKKHEALLQAAPVKEKLQQIESVQEIRDTYMEILTCKRNIKNNEQLIENYEKQIKDENIALEQVEKDLEKCLKEQREWNEKWNDSAPLIKEALKIEASNRGLQQSILESTQEINGIKALYDTEKKNKDALYNNIATNKKSLQEILSWFCRFNEYESIVPKADVILANINDINETEIQIRLKKELLAKSEILQKRQIEQLNEEQKRAERLNSTLTTEIATLRNQLVEGEPCPVCGSCHHVTIKSNTNTLQEEELKKAKKQVEENIEHLSQSIENNKSEIMMLSSSIAGYTSLCDERIHKTKELLNIFYNADELIKDKQFADNLKNIAHEWKEKREKEIALKEEIVAVESSLTSAEKKCKELQEQISEKEQRCETRKNELKTEIDRLRSILGSNKSVEQFEEELKKQMTETNNKMLSVTEKRNTLLVSREKQKGLLAQARETAKELDKEFNLKRKEIEYFLSIRTDSLTLEELHDLATIAPSKIIELREQIDILKTNEAKAVATFNERKRNIDEHNKIADRPLPHESKDELIELLQITNKERNRREERITEITLLIRNDKVNRKRSASLLEECQKSEENTLNWKKLNDLLGSADGAKFKLLVQGYTLDILLKYANIHLKEISHRYELARVSQTTLSIKVIDRDMLSEERSVHTLSGGESFLVSLALALALSSLSSNNMNIETLFIDEGFGSLDSETLRIAMDALERLQSQGRKIGIISHLSEITERITTQVEVTRITPGKSRVGVVKRL